MLQLDQLASHFPDWVSRVAFHLAFLTALVFLVPVAGVDGDPESLAVLRSITPYNPSATWSPDSIPAMIWIQFSFFTEHLPPDLVHYPHLHRTEASAVI